MEYIDALHEQPGGECFLCRYRDRKDQDAENLVLWRGRRSFVVINRFPYTSGHSMVAPYDHVAELGDLDGPIVQEMFAFLRDLQQVLAGALHAEGFNIGINLGRCAGAGLPDHLHVHIVPRWKGDTNFMPVFGDVRVIPQSLQAIYGQLREAGQRLGLPGEAP